MEQIKNTLRGPQFWLIIILFISSISFLSWFTFKDSFNVALSGDDWLLHYTVWTIFDVQKSSSFLNPSTYLCTYCPHYSFLSIIKYFWGYTPFYYYLVSLLFRIGISISLFFLVKKITGQIFPAILSGIFFSVSYIGIQTTDWVFNFTHYGGIIAVCIFLILYIRAKIVNNFFSLSYAALAFAAALIISPPRMHGLYPLIIILEVSWWAIEGKKYQFKKAGLRLLLILVAYKVVFSSPGYGTNEYNLSQVIKGLMMAKTMLSQGNTAFLLNPISTIGNYVLPDLLWQKLPLTGMLTLVPIGLVFALLSTGVLYLVNISGRSLKIYLLCLSLWFFIMFFIRSTNLDFYSIYQIGFGLIGGYTIIFSFWLFTQLRRNQPFLALVLALGQGWMFTFSLFPWLISPYQIFESSMRYSIQQAAGLAIWAATVFTIIHMSLNQKRLYYLQGTAYSVIAAFIIMHVLFSQQYLLFLKANRGTEIDKQLWSKIYQDIPMLPQDHPSVFFLTYDNYYLAEWDLRFGFSSRGALHYRITNQKVNPFMIYEYDKLLSMVTDGKALVAQGYPSNPLPIDHVYGYNLRNGELINTTTSLRKKLINDIQVLNK